LEAAGLNVRDRLRMSAFASIIQPHHIVRDLVTMQGIGTTGNGIGPCYADQAARMEYDRILDIRLGDLLQNFDHYFSMITRNLDAEMEKLNVSPEKIMELSGNKKIDIRHELENLKIAFLKLKENIEEDPFYLMSRIRNGAKVLLEGAQSIGLDNTYGTRPYTTGSKITPAAAAHGVGIDPAYLRNIYGIIKAIPSRVGHGPFIGEFGGKRSEVYWAEGNGYGHSRDEEMENYGPNGKIKKLEEALKSGDEFEMGVALRLLGHEYGASLRPRRVGALDLVYLRTLIQGLGVNGIFMSKGDQLLHFAQTDKGMIPIVDKYRLNGTLRDTSPFQNELLRQVEARYHYSDPFTKDISDIRHRDQLPEQMLTMISHIQDAVGATVIGIGVGKDREQYVPLAA
jgi:adenylosuccinate synthase